MHLVIYDLKSIPSLDCRYRIGTQKRARPRKGQVKLSAVFILNLSGYLDLSVFFSLSRPVYTLSLGAFLFSF